MFDQTRSGTPQFSGSPVIDRRRLEPYDVDGPVGPAVDPGADSEGHGFPQVSRVEIHVRRVPAVQPGAEFLGNRRVKGTDVEVSVAPAVDVRGHGRRRVPIYGAIGMVVFGRIWQ